jgi:hypothetical protein
MNFSVIVSYPYLCSPCGTFDFQKCYGQEAPFKMNIMNILYSSFSRCLVFSFFFHSDTCMLLIFSSYSLTSLILLLQFSCKQCYTRTVPLVAHLFFQYVIHFHSLYCICRFLPFLFFIVIDILCNLLLLYH